MGKTNKGLWEKPITCYGENQQEIIQYNTNNIFNNIVEKNKNNFNNLQNKNYNFFTFEDDKYNNKEKDSDLIPF